MLEVLKMSQSKIKSSRSYTRHSADYKKEALRLAEVHGVSKAASDLKLSESQIYAWRVQAEQAKSISEREQELSLENVKLKRLLAEKSEEVDILKKAAAYFARSLKWSMRLCWLMWLNLASQVCVASLRFHGVVFRVGKRAMSGASNGRSNKRL